MTRYSDSLRGYGHGIHVKCNFICQYCGYDGRAFPNWLQLTVDHVLPLKSGGTDDDNNKVSACQTCNSMTSTMKFPPGTTTAQALEEKRKRVRTRQSEFFEFWKKNVAPRYLEPWKTR